MPSSKKQPRSVERVRHLFLSDQSPSQDDEVGPSQETRPPGQLEMGFELDEGAEEVRRDRHQPPSSESRRSGAPLTLLDFLLDDEDGRAS
jgi:hypothetical protein